MIHYYS